MSAVLTELLGAGRAPSFQWRGRANTLLVIQSWLPPFLVTADSWGHGTVSPWAAAAPLHPTCPGLSGMVSGPQLFASTTSLSLRWLPWWAVSRAGFLPLQPRPCRAVPQPWCFPSPWQFRGSGGRARLAGGGVVPLAREGVGEPLLMLKLSFALEMGLSPSSLSARPPLPSLLPWAEVPWPHRTLHALLGRLEPALVLPVPCCICNALANIGMGCTRRRINKGRWSRTSINDPTELPC